MFTSDLIDEDRHYVWRYAAALPIRRGASAFGEMMTPLTTLNTPGATVLAKLDFLSPTGSFKDRGFAVLIGALEALGVRSVVEDSSGNAAASIAAYAARAGMNCAVFAPAQASAAKLVQSQAYGAEVIRVEGSRSDVATAAERRHDALGETVYASHNWHPWFIAGVATWLFEVWEQLGFRLPENIVAPAGSGSVVLGARLAADMLCAGESIDRLPRLYAAQPAACAPIVRAWEAGLEHVSAVERSPTMAEGASIADPVRGNEVLAALRESDGGAVAVSEDAIAGATVSTARQGIFIEPTSALAVAAVDHLIESGRIGPEETTVVALTGSGLKASATIGGLLESELS
jgi:threonine synthase